MKLLSNVGSHTKCVINWMLNLPAEADAAMQSFSLKPGSDIHVLRNDDFGVVIGTGNRRLAMDSMTAGKIWVGNLTPDTAGAWQE